MIQALEQHQGACYNVHLSSQSDITMILKDGAGHGLGRQRKAQPQWRNAIGEKTENLGTPIAKGLTRPATFTSEDKGDWQVKRRGNGDF